MGRDAKRWLQDHPEELCAAVLFAYFAARLIYLALSLHPAVPPDELTHYGRSVAFSRTFLVPDDSRGTHALGLLTHRPYLYYWAMGRLVPLSFLPLSAHPVPDTVFLRLANALLGMLCAVYAYRWIRLVSSDRLVRIFFLLLFTNTLMLTGISAAIHYDNGANLLAAMSIFYLFAWLERGTPNALAAWLLCSLAGLLVKFALLPLVALSGLLLLLRDWRALRRFPTALRAWLWPPRLAPAALAVAISLAGGLALSLYGGNWLHFGSLEPPADAVVGLESALENRIFARDWIVQSFRAGELEYADALAMTERIERPGDRSDAKALLAAARTPDEALLGPLSYAAAWGRQVGASALGYLGHLRMLKSDLALLPWLAMLALAGGAFVVQQFRRAAELPAMRGAALLVVGYVMVLLWLVHYPIYRASHHPELAVQGRYLFPVWVPLCGLVAFYLLHYFPRPLRVALAFAAGAYLLWGDLPFFVSNLEPRWLAQR